MKDLKRHIRKAVAEMEGYTPGEQPKLANFIKLNTNENPYPPSPKIAEALANFDLAALRRYPNARADSLRRTAAELNNAAPENVIVGNGSDDILTMVFRAFTSPALSMACLNPTYTLYWDLAAMQEAEVIKIDLAPRTFALPDDLTTRAQRANLLIIARPNAPTGNSFPREKMREICEKFDGVVLIDEAYADFADDNCMEFATTMPNVIVMRTFSKSYALAGIRAGYAVASREIVSELMKLKDSYNSDAIAQLVAETAMKDQPYLKTRVATIRRDREKLSADLAALGFEVVPSEANFVFAKPPHGCAKELFEFLRDRAVFVRFFDRPATRDYLRITVGTPEEMSVVTSLIKEFLVKYE